MTKTPIRIGLCTDLTGPYEGVDCNAGAEAIRMAIEQVGGELLGRRIELILGDHRNDPKLARTIAQHWCADGDVDLLISGAKGLSEKN